MQPPADDVDRIEHALNWRPTQFEPRATDRGATGSGARWVVRDARRSAFVKVGATPVAVDLFRREHANYRAIAMPAMPRLLGFFDDGSRPALAIEDLSQARWPPPWRPGDVDLLLASLGLLHGLTPPEHLERVQPDGGAAWQRVAEDPARWARLGICSADWLDANLPRLIEAAASAPLAGEALVHLDVRSDNVCFRDGQAILCDWPEAAIASPDLDVAFWLPSLEADGGPVPETILPNSPELAAWVAGFFFSRAALLDIPDAPHVRPLQLAQSRTALPWAARALGLPTPA